MQQVQKNAIDFALTGSLYGAGSYLLNSEPLNQHLLIESLQSAGAEAIATYGSDMVKPLLDPLIPPNSKDMVDKLINPVVSGAVLAQRAAVDGSIAPIS